MLEDIEWSDHVVLTTPMWWGGLPAKLKGLFDRAFQPGRVFDTENTRAGMPLPLLTGRTARLILTSDTPSWFLRIAYRNAIFHQLRGQIFGFVGIKPLRITHFSAASHPSENTVRKWVKKVERIAIQGK